MCTVHPNKNTLISKYKTKFHPSHEQVKCDNIKIHLDRQLAPNQREDGALTPRTAQPTDANTPGTSPNVGKSNGKFSDFWRNIPGKRNIFL